MFVSLISQTVKSKEMLPAEVTKYTADESGNRISNIPYEDIILSCTADEKALIPEGLSESGTPEDNAKAINSAIDALPQGGTVYIPEGTYKTMTVYLKSGITLFVAEGAELLSPDGEENEGSATPLDTALIVARNAENITVTGGGRINGNGISYTNEAENSEPLYALKYFNTYTRVIEARKRIRAGKDTVRNNIINLQGCKNVSLNNIILCDSAGWTCVLDNCSDVTVDRLIIDNDMHVANSDGIDITGGENYTITDCFIATGDDGIVLKPIGHEIKNVTVKNCTISSYANCFKIGTETQMDVSGITVKDCYFFIPDGFTYGYSGIAIESCDGAKVTDVTVENIEMEGVSSPLLIWLGNRYKYDKKQTGEISGITIRNITAENIELPFAVTGCIDEDGTVRRVKDVVIKNLTATYRDSEENLDIRQKVGNYTMSGYPDITRVSHVYFISHELSKYWDLPCYGGLFKHCENVKYENITVTPRSCNERPEYYLDDMI